MTEKRFLNLAYYGSLQRPEDVSPARWAGMLKWLDAQERDQQQWEDHMEATYAR